jgi:hypothetical protein
MSTGDENNMISDDGISVKDTQEKVGTKLESRTIDVKTGELSNDSVKFGAEFSEKEMLDEMASKGDE